MKVSIRAQYPATGKYDWREALEALAPIRDIELAFHSPDNFVRFVELEKVIGPIMDLGLDVPTIHMAHARLSNLGLFIPVLVGTLRIARAVDCRNIVLHPNYGTPKDLDTLIDHAIIPLLEDYDCNLLWETFSGKRRVLTAWEQLAAFCQRHERNHICYDICHMQRETADEVIEDIETYWHLIKGFHFSNWQPLPFKQHLPLNTGVLDYGKIARHLRLVDFEGNVTLEYMPEFHGQLVADAVHLMEG